MFFDIDKMSGQMDDFVLPDPENDVIIEPAQEDVDRLKKLSKLKPLSYVSAHVNSGRKVKGYFRAF